MVSAFLPVGALNACQLRDVTVIGDGKAIRLTTLVDLLNILSEIPPAALPMLRTTCSLLGSYLNLPADQVTIDSVNESREGFRSFLESCKYADNSIRTYVNHVRILLRSASEFGWRAREGVPERWQSVITLAGSKECDDLVRYLARTIKSPADVTIEDVDSWVQMRVQAGASERYARSKKTWFWQIIFATGHAKDGAESVLRGAKYGISINLLAPDLRRELNELLRWKQAVYALGRPKDGRHRAVTAKNLRELICSLIGFAVSILGEEGITCLAQLVQERIISAYADWCINERKLKSGSVHHNLRLLSAAMRQHPSYKSVDFSWFKPLMDSIPLEPRSELKKRKAEKYLEYNVVESIPSLIRAERSAAGRRGERHLARLVMRELIMKWLITLPWRQRNIRDCRISGPSPNLFRGKIAPFSDINKPNWVIQEELKNPTAEFWQFRFSPEETKTGIDVNSLLPRQLVGLLEEYLKTFRHKLFDRGDPGTLFVGGRGKPMTRNQMTQTVSELTMRYGGRRVTPHPFRDIVAFTWLKEHPKDYLTLSKMLWHSNVNTTIQIYGSRFNESNGVSAMESWLDEREANST